MMDLLLVLHGDQEWNILSFVFMMSAENENKCITIYNIIVNSLLSLLYLCDIRKLYTAQNISI